MVFSALQLTATVGIPTDSAEASYMLMVADRVVGDNISDNGRGRLRGRRAKEEVCGYAEAGNGGRRQKECGRSSGLFNFERIWDESGLSAWRARPDTSGRPIYASDMGRV